jgi:hypothetical protein
MGRERRETRNRLIYMHEIRASKHKVHKIIIFRASANIETHDYVVSLSGSRQAKNPKTGIICVIIGPNTEVFFLRDMHTDH